MSARTDSTGSPGWLVSALVHSRFLTTSILLHLVAVSLIGSYVIFREVQEADSFITSSGGDGFLSESEEAAPMPEPPAPQLQQLEQPPMPVQAAAAEVMNAPSMIVTQSLVSATSVVAAPVPQASHSTNATSGLPAINSGGRAGVPGLPGKLTTGTLFGAKIETKKLGVILDVSGSAQKFLLEVVDEVDSKFKNAEIILFAGCGMHGDRPAELYRVQSAEELKEELRKEGESKGKGILGYIGEAMYKKDPNELQRLLKKLVRRDNVLLLVIDPRADPTSGGQYAFQRLVHDGVDTVYWFADFQDRVTKEHASQVADSLVGKQIKLVAHNFSGEKVRPEVQTIVDRTGGQSISQIPGGRRQKDAD